MELLLIMAFTLFAGASTHEEAPLSAASSATLRPAPTVVTRTPAPAPGLNPVLLKAAAATATAPSQYTVLVKTTKGEFEIKVVRKWSPNGADRFYNLVKLGYFSNIGIFRVIPNFMAQFGIHDKSKVNDAWRNYSIMDDKRTEDTQSNLRGMVTFAKTGAPNSRGTQLFINYKDNQRLDGMGFTPIGQVVKGMDVVDSIHKTGENPPTLQGALQSKGNAALKAQYPKADYIKSMSLKAQVLR